MENQRIYWHILLHAQRVGRVRLLQWMEQYGSAERVVEAGFDPHTRLLFGTWTVGPWEKDRDEAARAGVTLITYQDEDYPQLLKNIPDFPLVLYVKGTLQSEEPSVALIGTRQATLYGKQAAHQLAREVAASGVCIVSGLARGIDTAAHEGALAAGGRTIAVIGSGLSQIYPQENRSLAEKIAQKGAVISEYPMHMAPAKGLFPRRNRIISGIASGICLVESPSEGGGMLTMGIGEKQGKHLFAVPGRIDWPTFEGNHALIKSGKAELVEKGSDLLKHLNISENQIVKQLNSTILTPEERAFIETLPNEEKSIEELVLLTQLPVMQLNVFLTRLVLKKVVKEFPGKIYKKSWQSH